MEHTAISESKHYPTWTILIIGAEGLVRLNCPFMVMCIVPVDLYKEEDILQVQRVKVSSDMKLLYIIHNKGYSYIHFLIIT